ncbi:unnamed protein product, partial [Rotaria sp. Silwood2]
LRRRTDNQHKLTPSSGPKSKSSHRSPSLKRSLFIFILHFCYMQIKK